MEIIQSKIQHYIVFNIGHDIGNEVKICESELLFRNESFYITKKVIKNVTLIITHVTKGDFLRGYAYILEKEYPILNYCNWSSLQIKDLCYDNISVCEL